MQIHLAALLYREIKATLRQRCTSGFEIRFRLIFLQKNLLHHSNPPKSWYNSTVL